MNKDEVIKELESLGFQQINYSDHTIINGHNFLYTTSSPSYIMFYVIKTYRRTDFMFKFSEGNFYKWELGPIVNDWIPIEITDIATMVLLYGNSNDQ